MTRLLALLLLFSAPALHAQPQARHIEQAVRRLIRGHRATVGVAVLFGDGEAATVNNHIEFPLMSVFKYPVAFAALQEMERRRIAPDSLRVVDASRLTPGTYSPLRDKSGGRDVRLSYADLVKYTVSLSDNHTCDLLIELAGGIRRVDSCMAGLGIAPLHLSETEHSMHVDPRRCYHNRATPLAVATLLKRTYDENLLSPPYAELLKQAMLETSTGPD